MKLELYSDIIQYADEVMEILEQHEIQNNLVISNCLRGKAGANTTNWFMAAVKDAKGTPWLAALMTPPHNLVLYESNNIPDDAAVDLLIHEMISLQVQVPGFQQHLHENRLYAGV